MADLIALAGELYDAFITKTRDNGEVFVCLKDGSPEWMKDTVFAAHDHMLPDDFRYALVKEAAGAIHDAGGEADLDECAAEFSDEVNVYNSDLLAWVASNLTRMSYCDDALSEYGEVENLSQLLALGQSKERREVFDSVLSSLEGLADDEEDEGDDE